MEVGQGWGLRRLRSWGLCHMHLNLHPPRTCGREQGLGLEERVQETWAEGMAQSARAQGERMVCSEVDAQTWGCGQGGQLRPAFQPKSQGPQMAACERDTEAA